MKADTIKVKIAKSLRVGTVDNRLQNLSLFDWLTDVQHMCTFSAEANLRLSPSQAPNGGTGEGGGFGCLPL